MGKFLITCSIILTATALISCSTGRAEQPLDALDAVASPQVDLSPQPFIETLGIASDYKEILALPYPDESKSYLDLFNFQPTEAGLPPPKSGYSISILMYHGFTVGPAHNRYQTSAADFRAQMEFLRQNQIPVIPLGTLADAYKSNDWSAVPTRAVVITIDDGQRNAYSIAFPILKEYNAPFTLAIYTDYVAKSGTLSWEQLKEMMASGAEIGCHTASHPNLKRLTNGLSGDAFRRVMEKETIQPRKILEEGIGAPVRYFFYPYGVYTKQTQDFLTQAGYDCILTTNDGFVSPSSHANALARNEVYRGITLDKYRRIVIPG